MRAPQVAITRYLFNRLYLFLKWLSLRLFRNETERLFFKQHRQSEPMSAQTSDQPYNVHLIYHVIFNRFQCSHVGVPVPLTVAHSTQSSIPQTSEPHLPQEHNVLLLSLPIFKLGGGFFTYSILVFFVVAIL
jgi:hypothetical protein